MTSNNQVKPAKTNQEFNDLVAFVKKGGPKGTKEYYGAMELNKLEVAVRGHDVAPNKIYNYMGKNRIAYKVFGKTKKIHKDEVVRYLTQCRQISKSDFNETFKDFL